MVTKERIIQRRTERTPETTRSNRTTETSGERQRHTVTTRKHKAAVRVSRKPKHGMTGDPLEKGLAVLPTRQAHSSDRP